MEEGFTRSREFLVAAIVAGIVVSGGVAALAMGEIFSGESSALRDGCSARHVVGVPITAARSEATSAPSGWRVREIQYLVEASALNGTDGGAFDVCMRHGKIHVTPSADGNARVVFRFEAQGADAAEALAAARSQARFAISEGTLQLAAWHASTDEGGTRVENVRLRVTVELPETGPFAGKASSTYGDIHLGRVMLGATRLVADHGRIELADTLATSNLTLTTDYGSIDAKLAGVGPGTIRVQSDAGRVTLALPTRADVGYDVRARSETSAIDVSIGPTEKEVRERDGARHTTTARTQGYDSRPTKVIVRVDTDYGRIRITTTGAAAETGGIA